jgi:NAD+ synthase (glutamine-hydrolysing)
VFLNLSASPFNVYKIKTRFALLSAHARKHGIPLVFVNQVGANDELIFDGNSLSFDKEGVPNAALSGFSEDVVTIDTNKPGSANLFQARTEIATVHDALALGLRDYAHKCGFSKAILGLSGGIDSAVTLAIAVEALGAENMLGICMPSLYSSESSITDSRKLAENYGVTMKTIPIENVYASYLDTLTPDMDPTEIGITQENLQARVRGNILMAYANKFGYLTLSTGNKSEMAVGYCTLYGDMSGGLSVLADVPKTEVYNLAEYINRDREQIPKSIIDKPPSAELRPNQADQDTLPSYDVLDRILHCYVEERCSAEDLVSDEVPAEVIRWVVEAVDRNEYKRRQAAPGLRVSSKSFGSGRRMPVAAKYNQFGQYWQFGDSTPDLDADVMPDAESQRKS